MISLQITFADVAQFVGTVVIVLFFVWLAVTYKLEKRRRDDSD